MFTIDKFRRRESKGSVLAERFDRVDAEAADSRKIIDFESARQAFERDQSPSRESEEFKRNLLGDVGGDRSASVAESLVTLVLVAVIGFALLLGMIWGF